MYQPGGEGMPNQPHTARGRQPLDEIDRVLVAALREDARVSYAELARKVGLTAPSVQERVRRLERRGVIRAYRTMLGAAETGLGVCALVSVYKAESAEREDVLAGLAEVPQLEDCWVVAGDEEFVVKVRVADVGALEGVIATIQRIPGIARTRTTVVLSTRWETRPVPLPDDEEATE
jgi:Lrp/AsnC family leucine-responsive transcriptional regulator